MDDPADRDGLDLWVTCVKFPFNESSGEGRVETDIRYYRRRACEEMSAASRAVTSAARDRRLYLVNVYLERLRALNAPAPFDDDQLAAMAAAMDGRAGSRSAFAWSGVQSERA